MSITGTGVLVGPCRVRASREDDVSDWSAAALASIDDEFALVDDQPVAVVVLWRELFQSILEGSSAVLVCPTWWQDRRVGIIADTARAAAADIAVIRRAGQLASMPARRPSVVIEISESFVALILQERPDRIVSRNDHPVAVADNVTDEVASMVTGGGAVVIDRPDGVGGAVELGALMADRLRARRFTVTVIDDTELLQAVDSRMSTADETRPTDGQPDVVASKSRPTRASMFAGLVAATASVIVVAALAAGGTRSSTPRATLLVEGRVVVEVPAAWSARRITEGPGSARVQVSSPTDPHAAVHVTQSAVPGDETLPRTADTLRRAMLDEPPGVFVDLNPEDRRGGRPAVTYREIRDGHDIFWTVLLDGSMRISIGCQSARGSEAAVWPVCDRAIASARDIGEFAGTIAGQPRSNNT